MSFVYDSLRPYQRDGAHWLRKRSAALFTDEQGLGKTIQTLGSIVAEAALSKEPSRQRWHLVLCPSVAVNNTWAPEIRRWLQDLPYELLVLSSGQTLAQRNAALLSFTPKANTRHVFVVTNIESLRIKAVPDDLPRNRRDVIRFKMKKEKFVYAPENCMLSALLTREWQTVICDESQRALIHKGGIQTQTRAGFMLVASRRRIALTGTPMRGRPEQLWGTLNWLRPDLYRSKWKWIAKYFSIDSNGFSNYIVGNLLSDGMARMGVDLQEISLRRTKAEVLPDLPPKTYAGTYLIDGDENSPLGVWLEPSSGQKKQLHQLAKDGIVTSPTGEDIVDGPLAVYTRGRQLAAAVHTIHKNEDDKAVWTPTLDSPKLDWLLNWLDNSGGAKIVVVSQFTSHIKAFLAAVQEAGYTAGAITGGVLEKRRREVVEGFQHGDMQVCMLNTKAGGVSLTLDAADYLVFLDETAIPDDQEQAEDRIHRASRNHNVTIYYLRTRGTIEEEVAYIAAARQDVLRYLMDGARGVEYARRVYLESLTQAA